MKLLVDTNILFSAVLRDGTTRRILVLASIEFLAPEHVNPPPAKRVASHEVRRFPFFQELKPLTSRRTS
jgi:hypothetical protein